jgi:hypothetical protein
MANTINSERRSKTSTLNPITNRTHSSQSTAQSSRAAIPTDLQGEKPGDGSAAAGHLPQRHVAFSVFPDTPNLLLPHNTTQDPSVSPELVPDSMASRLPVPLVSIG